MRTKALKIGATTTTHGQRLLNAFKKYPRFDTPEAVVMEGYGG